MASRIKRKQRAIFLDALRRTGNVTISAARAGLVRTSVHHARKTDAAFAAEWAGAVDESVDLLIEEARRRGNDGVDEPQFYQGNVCGYVRKYSDSLLMFLIKGKRPEYATERREMSGRDGQPLGPVDIAVNFIKAPNAD